MINIKKNEKPLFICNNDGTYKATANFTQEQVVHLAKNLVMKNLKQGDYKLGGYNDTVEFLKLNIAALEYEVFVVLALDAQNRVIDYKEIANGTVNKAAIYPREVIKYALLHNASSLIFSHNHPSGSNNPSIDDRRMTTHLKRLCEDLDIKVLDHIIIGGDGAPYSFAEHGLL